MTASPTATAAGTQPPLDRLLAEATGSLGAAGLRAGDVALSVLPNDRRAFALGWAAALAGVVQVPLSHGATPAEVVRLGEASGAVAVVVDPSSPPGVGVQRALRGGGLPEVALGVAPPQDPDAPAPRTRALHFTSGTTGRRKGVVVGVHDPAWGRTVLDDESAAFGGRHGDTHLVVSPLTHSGPVRHALVTADRGGEVHVLPRFDVELWLAALRALRPTSMFVVPTHLHRLLAHPALRPDDLASLTLLVHAGAPCSVGLKQRLLDVAPDDAVHEFYGATEGQFTTCDATTWRSAPGTVGTARPGRALEVRDEVGCPVPAGTVGTVWASAPAHARWHYLDDPRATAAAWDGDMFTVGDLGRLDARGRLTLVGRRHDLIVSGGVNVYPAEVEAALLEQPTVGEAAVVGVADDEWGQRVVAVVTSAPDGPPADGEAIRAAARRRLPRAAVPRRVAVVDELPRTTTGKVARARLATLVSR